MLQQQEQFVGLLLDSDRELIARDLADLQAILSSASNSEQEGLWTPALTGYIAHIDPQHLLDLEWVTEKHYASLMRQATSQRELDYLYLIGYARVISLMMMIDTYMGYSMDDLYFILTLLKLYSTNAQDLHGGPKILEVGCGAGDLLVDLAGRGYRNVVGIDISPAAIRLARRKLEEHHLAIEGLHCASLEDFTTVFPDARFDLIIHCHIIEHIVPAQAPAFLDQISKCLTREGYMVVITPSKLTGPHDNTRFFRPPGSEPEGFHLREYSLSELKQLLSQSGFGRFMAMNSLPYANRYWDTISEENFQAKIRMEPFIESLDWKLRKPLVDGLYFQAVVCQKLKESEA
jgi:2-polyprenyl-3-methyl-5-hydroxy-6-metoxy-1,4-benzoquinol methylase